MSRLLATILLLLNLILSSCSDSNPAPPPPFDAAAYVGTWTGTWTNLKFSTTGAATATVTQNGSAYNINLDLGGSVFGGGDPPAEPLTATIGATSANLDPKTTATYGLLNATLESNGAISASGENITVGTVSSFALAGTWSAATIELFVTITFNDTTTAQASAVLTKQ